MTALLWLALLSTAVPTVQTGRAVEYRPGLMEHVYRIRVHQGLVAPGWQGGFASRPSCATIGRVYAAQFRNARTGLYSAPQAMLQVDCAQARDYRGQLAEGLVIESDYGTALATGWAYAGRTKARVWPTNETWR